MTALKVTLATERRSVDFGKTNDRTERRLTTGKTAPTTMIKIATPASAEKKSGNSSQNTPPQETAVIGYWNSILGKIAFVCVRNHKRCHAFRVDLGLTELVSETRVMELPPLQRDPLGEVYEVLHQLEPESGTHMFPRRFVFEYLWYAKPTYGECFNCTITYTNPYNGFVTVGTGEGRSKQDAKQEAARQILACYRVYGDVFSALNGSHGEFTESDDVDRIVIQLSSNRGSRAFTDWEGEVNGGHFSNTYNLLELDSESSSSDEENDSELEVSTSSEGETTPTVPAAMGEHYVLLPGEDDSIVLDEVPIVEIIPTGNGDEGAIAEDSGLCSEPTQEDSGCQESTPTFTSEVNRSDEPTHRDVVVIEQPPFVAESTILAIPPRLCSVDGVVFILSGEPPEEEMELEALLHPVTKPGEEETKEDTRTSKPPPTLAEAARIWETMLWPVAPDVPPGFVALPPPKKKPVVKPAPWDLFPVAPKTPVILPEKKPKPPAPPKPSPDEKKEDPPRVAGIIEALTGKARKNARKEQRIKDEKKSKQDAFFQALINCKAIAMSMEETLSKLTLGSSEEKAVLFEFAATKAREYKPWFMTLVNLGKELGYSIDKKEAMYNGVLFDFDADLAYSTYKGFAKDEREKMKKGVKPTPEAPQDFGRFTVLADEDLEDLDALLGGGEIVAPVAPADDVIPVGVPRTDDAVPVVVAPVGVPEKKKSIKMGMKVFGTTPEKKKKEIPIGYVAADNLQVDTPFTDDPSPPLIRYRRQGDVYLGLPLHEGKIEVPADEKYPYVVVTNCDYVLYDKSAYKRRCEQYYNCDTGISLPDNVKVFMGDELIVVSESKNHSIYGAEETPKGRKIRIVPAFQKLNIVVEAREFQWFKQSRIALEQAWENTMTVISLGHTRFRRTLYTNYSKLSEDVVISAEAEKLLKEKSGAAFTAANQAQLLRKITLELNHVPHQILADTVIYFTQYRALIQKRINSTLDACDSFVRDKNAYMEPSMFQKVLLSCDPQKRMYSEEGSLQLTSKVESAKCHAQKKVCCWREEYAKSDPTYATVFAEYGKDYMFQPTTKQEAVKMLKRGCQLTDCGLTFRTMTRSHTRPYSTLGTTFATQSAIIDHKDTEEYCKAAQRLLSTRENEVIKRERSGLMERRILAYLKSLLSGDSMFDSDHELTQLEQRIKMVDPKYRGSSFNTEYCEEKEIDLSGIRLSETDENFCYMRAAIMSQHARVSCCRKGIRLVDAQEDLKDYIRTIGSKVALRLGYLRDHEQESGVAKGYLDVQMKPHEAQKYKAGKLKFGRMVVSVVGQGWVDANPTVIYDGKHLMEHPTIVTPLPDGFKVEYMDVEKEFRFPHQNARRLDKRFWMRSVLSDTSLADLASVVTEMEIQANLGYAFINHGDDMLSAYKGEDGHIVWCEGDIANNDSSHVDDCFRQLYLVDRFRDEDVIHAYAQCAYPVKFVNPMEPNEYGYFRSQHGMRLISGSVLTTYKNCAKSSTVGLSHVFYGGGFESAASFIGMDVTTVIGKLEDVTFLSKIMYRLDTGEISVCTDVASLMRSFGRITGDANGSSKIPVHTRVMEHQSGVVKGYIHEPDSQFILAMRAGHIEPSGGLDTLTKKINIAVRSVQSLAGHTATELRRLREIEGNLTAHDHGLIRHYYGSDPENIIEGRGDYIRLIKMIQDTPAYGYTIFSRFVDAAMRKRYGMAATVISE